MKRPAVGLVTLYAAGIWIGSQVSWSAGVVLLGATLWLVLFAATRQLLLLLAAVFFAGILSYREAVSLRSPRHVERLILHPQSAGLRGIVASPPEVLDGTQAQFKLRVTALRLAQDWQPAEGLLWMSVATNLPYGAEIECVAALRRPEPARNPGGFDLCGWLARQGIHWTARVASNDPCRVLALHRGNPLTEVSVSLRRYFDRALCAGLTADPKCEDEGKRLAALLAAMVLGERSEIPSDTYAAFQRTGVFHVFAVSGLHVGLVTALVLLVLRALQMPTRWSGLAAIPLLILYVWATGARPGAVRALIMAGVWQMGRMLLRPAEGLNNLAVAALILLVCNPRELFDGGFQLSFTVVAAILILGPRLQQRFARWWLPDPLVPRQLLPRWRTALEKPRVWFLQLLSCSVAAWLGVAPLLATYFHLFSPVTIVANLLVIPLMMIITALGMAACAAYAVWPWLAETFNNANYFFLSAIVRCVEWLSRWPGGHLYVQAPPLWLVGAYYALALVWLATGIPLRWRRWLFALGAAASIAAVAWTARQKEDIELTILDLDEGVAAFVNLPGERYDFLIDGGGGRALLPFLRSQGADRLDSVVVTCKDNAHVSGLTNLFGEVSLGRVIMSDTRSMSRPYRSWRDQLIERRIPIQTVQAGASWQARNLKITVLHPPAGSRAVRADDNSLVLLLEHGPTRLLWASDIGATGEQHLLRSGADLRCQVLIKGSHGKEPSGSEALLDAARPELVVQVANRWPSFRQPDPALRERVERRGARWLCTEETGAVTLRLTKSGWSVRTRLAQEAR